jgi:hypothetical protein
VRFRRDFDLRERVGLAVEFCGFASLDGRARHEPEVVRHINEQDFAVIRVNAFFHGLSFNLAVANPRAALNEAAFRREPLAYGRKTAIMPENQSLGDFSASGFS